MGEVVQFPRSIIVDEKIRRAERQIARQLDIIENCDPNGPTVLERANAANAPMALEWAHDSLRQALAEREMLTAADAMRFGGLIYRAQPSQNGAH